MRTWAKGSSPAALLAVGVMALGNGTALADTSGGNSVGGGNQVNLPVSLPVDISGNAIGIVGDAEAQSRGGAIVDGRGSGGLPNRTSGDNSLLGGNQVDAPITAPVNACGTAVSLFGSAEASCKGGAKARSAGRGGTGGNSTDGHGSLLGGNQITAPITAPLNPCGNSVAIFGEATAGCKGGAKVKGVGGAGGNWTSGGSALLGGNQAVAPIAAPVDICGNSVAAFGKAFSGCTGGASAGGGGYHKRFGSRGSGGNDTDGRFGAGSGNQVIAPITLPIAACGNAVGNATAACKGGAAVTGTGGAGRGAGGNRTSGRNGVLSGTQAVAPVTAPVNVCGNAAAILGKADPACTGGVKAGGGGPAGSGGNSSSGRSGAASGNQVVAPVTAPVNACGNAAAVLGDAAAGCLGSAKTGGGHGHGGYGRHGHNGHHGHARQKVSAVHQAGGMLPVVPLTPDVGGVKDTHSLAHRKADAGRPALPSASIPVVSDVKNTLGLPKGFAEGVPALSEGMPQVRKDLPQAPGQLPRFPGGLSDLPNLPGLSALPVSTSTFLPMPAHRLHGKPAQARPKHAKPEHTKPSQARSPQPKTGPLQPVTDLVGTTPVGNAAARAADALPVDALPVDDLGLMSAAQPTGVTGMNAGSLLALALGTMFAASAVLFATTRRLRLRRK